MKDFLQYFLGIIQKIAFLGVLAVIFCFFRYNLSFSQLIASSMLIPSTLSAAFLQYLFWSMCVLPLITLINALCLKADVFGDDIYFDQNFLIIIIDILINNNLMSFIDFPSRIFLVLFKHDKPRFASTIEVSIWMLNIVFIIAGIINTF
jgi:hypothetical protein